MADSAPLWCVAIGLSCAAWRVLTATGRIARPRPRRGTRFLLGAITALLVVAVAASFRTLNGLAAGTALLVVMGALKVLESRSRRDDAIVVGVALFLLLAAALAGQALWRVPLYLLLIVRRVRRVRAHRASRQRADAARRAAPRGARAGHVHTAGGRLLRILSAHLRAVLDAAARQRRRPPASRTRCRRAASASSPPNTIRRFARVSKVRRRGAPRCTGAARC